MKKHKEREHALLSASSAAMWLACTPSARLGEQFPDTTSSSAAEGTLAHELAEAKLRNYFYTTDFGKRKLSNFIKKLKENALWDDEMMRHTDEYLDYIKAAALSMKAQPNVAIEKRIDYSSYAQEGFGTADCILIGSKTLHVIDFKYGKGVPVGAEGNPQLSLYALGAYEAYKILYPIEAVKLSIVQPRMDNISEWECSIEELLAWGEYVREKAALAWEGKGEYRPSKETCQFCRARAQCRARSDHNVRQAFDIGELPPLISDEEVGERLATLEDVVRYQKDLQEYALAQCLAGKTIPGWKVVEGRGSREWTDMDSAFETLQAEGIDKAMLFEARPLTLAQIEKIVGKKEFAEMVGDKVIKKAGKPTLVKESDKRQAVTHKITAEEAFKEEK